MQTKRIVFVTTNHYAATGGSEVLWSKTAHYLLEQGMATGACARLWSPLPKHLAALKSAGCNLFLIQPSSSGLIDKAKRAVGQCFGSSVQSRLGAWLESMRPDLVVFSMGNSVEGFEWIEVCRRKNLPYALLIQLVSEHNWPDDASAKKLIEIYQNAKVCFFVSHGNHRLVEKMAGFEVDNYQVVENPYTVPFDTPFVWPEDHQPYRLACVANLHSLHKGQDVLFEVLRAPKWKERPIEWNLFGEGPHRETLERLKGLWGLDKVRFCGYSNDISAVWKTHHGLVMPSRMEGMPLALKEAMLSGRVSIVTDVGGNSELIRNGVNGFLAKAPTAELLDDALEKAWARRSDWSEIGFTAYQDAHREMSSDPVSDFGQKITDLVSGRV